MKNVTIKNASMKADIIIEEAKDMAMSVIDYVWFAGESSQTFFCWLFGADYTGVFTPDHADELEVFLSNIGA